MVQPVDLDYDPATTDIHNVMVRMPAELHDRLRAAAARNDRSVAQTIRFALRSYLDSEGARL